MSKVSNEKNQIFEELDRLAYLVSILLTVLLLVASFMVQRWLPDHDILLNFREMVYGIVQELLPIPLIFVVSYIFLRKIQTLRAAQEREELIENITNRLASKTENQILRTRSMLIPLEEQIQDASDVCIAGVSAITISLRHLGLLEKKIKEGCKVRILLLDPDSPSLQTWNRIMKVTTTEQDIRTSLELLSNLTYLESSSGKCEIRLLDTFLPFSMVAANFEKKKGSVVIEFHVYKSLLEERPHIFVTPMNNPLWFDFYRNQFDTAWEEATV